MIQSARPGTNWLVIAAGALCAAVGNFDLYGVNIVLPQLGKDFSVPPTVSQWVVLGYLLPIMALAVPMGRWLDTVGQRSAMLTMCAGFGAASLAAGLSPTLPILLMSRIVQGAFGAALFVLNMVIAYSAASPRHQERALAAVASAGSFGALGGPTLGAFVATRWGWPWIFVVAAPAMGVVMIAVARAMPADARVRLPSRGVVADVVLLGTAAALLLLALTWAQERNAAWLALMIPGPPLILAWKRLNPQAPLLTLLRRPAALTILLAIGLGSAASIAPQYLLSFFMEGSLGVSVTGAGTALLPIAVLSAAGAQLAAPLIRVVGAGRVAAAGFTLMAAGIILLLGLGPSWSTPDIAVRVGVMGLGQGLLSTACNRILFGLSPASLLASAGSTASFFRNLGYLGGPAITTSLWAAAGYSTAGMRLALLTALVWSVAGGAAAVHAAHVHTRCSERGG